MGSTGQGIGQKMGQMKDDASGMADNLKGKSEHMMGNKGQK